MRTSILILALFFLSFSLNSAEQSQNLNIEQPVEIRTVFIHHQIGNNGETIELEIPIEALPYHLLHGDHQGGPCEPPLCG